MCNKDGIAVCSPSIFEKTRGLKAVLNDDYEPVDMTVLILKLPNLASIHAKESFSSDRIVSVLQGAKLARKFTKLEPRDTEERVTRAAGDRERRAEQ